KLFSTPRVRPRLQQLAPFDSSRIALWTGAHQANDSAQTKLQRQQYCQPGREKIPTTSQRKSQHRRSKSPPATKARCKLRKAAGSKRHSMLLDPERAVAE